MSFRSDAERVIAALDEYHRESRSGQGPVIRQPPIKELIDKLELEALIREGGLSEDRLSRFLKEYLAATTRLHHPAYLAHQVAVPHYSGALASLIDGFTNNAMAIYEMGPAAAAIELFILQWLMGKVGWKPAPLQAVPGDPEPGAGGVLTHGGSLANLTAFMAARGRIAPDAWKTGMPDDLILLAPPVSHYSIGRAAGIMGLGQKAVLDLAVDENGKVLPDRLPSACDRIRDQGKRILALVANAGSTALGLYDPLEEISSFCRERGLWLHVDGAHGASALVSKRHRERLRGVEGCDSLVWDAHKLLRTPTLCAAVLVRDARDLDRAFEQEASYLFHPKEQPGFDLIHRTVECTKAGLGLRLFAVLASLGEKGLADYIDRQYDLCAQAHDFLSRLEDIECAVAPESNILCFRVPGGDERQLSLRDRLIAEGDFYLSTAEVNGRRFLRLVFMNPDTELGDIERLADRIRSLAAV